MNENMDLEDHFQIFRNILHIYCQTVLKLRRAKEKKIERFLSYPRSLQIIVIFGIFFDSPHNSQPVPVKDASKEVVGIQKVKK